MSMLNPETYAEYRAMMFKYHQFVEPLNEEEWNHHNQ